MLRPAVIALALLLAGRFLAVPSYAQAPPPTPAPAPDPDANRGRELYEAGERKYAEGRYGEAIKFFLEAFALSNQTGLWFNIANTYERMGEYAKAVEALKKFTATKSADNHAAVRRRPVRIGSGGALVGGVSEVCVHPDHRGQGHVRSLLAEVHVWLTDRSVPFSLLFGNPSVYTSSGYARATNPFRYWHAIESRWIAEPVPSALVRTLLGEPWPDGLVDLRGVLF